MCEVSAEANLADKGNPSVDEQPWLSDGERDDDQRKAKRSLHQAGGSENIECQGLGQIEERDTREDHEACGGEDRRALGQVFACGMHLRTLKRLQNEE